MDELKAYLTHTDETVKEAAVQLDMLVKARDSGDIDKEQFEELAEDLLEANKVRRMATSLERKIMILQAFNAIRAIIGVVTK